MRFDWRKLPKRPEIAARLIATLVIIVAIFFAWPSFAFVAQILFCIVIIAVFAAQLESTRGRVPAIIEIVILSYVATRTLGTGGLNPLTVSHWYPYPLQMWLPYERWYLLAILAGSWLLQPLWPLAIHLTPATRKGSAVALVVAVLVVWSWLSDNFGAASAGLISALAVLLAIMLAADHRWTSVGAVACAAFLAFSAFAQHGPPDVSNLSGSTPDIDLGYTGPNATRPFFNTANLEVYALILPSTATPLGCPSVANVSVFVSPVNSLTGDKLLKKDLSTAKYMLDVTGVTKITEQYLPSAAHQSHIVKDFNSLKTQWLSRDLDFGGATGPGEILSFNMPLLSWRAMGACYVQIPNLEGQPSPSPYSNQPAVGTVELLPPNGSAVDVSQSTLHPVAVPDDPRSYEWTCYDQTSKVFTHAGCPAVAVIETNWSGPYDQVALIVVGALLAIAAERWFTRLDAVAEQAGRQLSSGEGSDSKHSDSQRVRRNGNTEDANRDGERPDTDDEVSQSTEAQADAEKGPEEPSPNDE